MIPRNENFQNLAPSYLFSEVRQRKEIFEKSHPEISLISLGIGDTTLPLIPPVVHALHEAADRLGHPTTYMGYGPDLGHANLREAISQTIYDGRKSPDEIIISDGAKCDLGRLQLLFGQKVSIAVTDPSYPVYADSSMIVRGQPCTYIPASVHENFVPDLSQMKDRSVLFLCSPNNPTGKVFTKDELAYIIQTCAKKGCVIIFDVAYQSYIQSEELPRSIFEIEGAEEVAIEVGSFSKMAGFSGVRLGWTALSPKLLWGLKTPLIQDTKRLFGTLFNGASYLSQYAGLAALSKEGQEATSLQIKGYLANSKKVKDTLLSCSVPVWGGDHSPYVWIQPHLGTSWQAFDTLLAHGLITTPGIGFGPSGEGFLRLSSFQQPALIREACSRLRHVFH